ncbi:MAG: hypothetical protein ACRD0J_04710, partial [Acidimicrobiales bacterium]
MTARLGWVVAIHSSPLGGGTRRTDLLRTTDGGTTWRRYVLPPAISPDLTGPSQPLQVEFIDTAHG